MKQIREYYDPTKPRFLWIAARRPAFLCEGTLIWNGDGQYVRCYDHEGD